MESINKEVLIFSNRTESLRLLVDQFLRANVCRLSMDRSHTLWQCYAPRDDTTMEVIISVVEQT